MRTLLASLIALALVGPAHAQAPYLVDDINEGSDPSTETLPKELAPSGATLYFVGWDEVHQWELRQTDGTAAGTRLVMDLDPWNETLSLTQLTGAAGSVFYVRRQPSFAHELWTSDGSVAGTKFVRNVLALPASNSSLGMVSLGPIVFYRAMDGATPALWRSDGTPAGTFVVRPGDAEELTVAGQALYFRASDPATGSELWRSDGTVGGTVLVRDICPGTCSGSPNGLGAFGDRLFFAATDPATGNEPWTSDGTPAGTTLLRDLTPGPDPSSVGASVTAGGRLFFSESTALWTSDGSTAGTVLVSTILVNGGLTALGSNVMFWGREPATGSEPWFSDGTAAGTHLVSDVCPGPCDALGTGGPGSAGWIGAGNLFYFWRRSPDPSQGTELWRSDGSAPGTFNVRTWREASAFASFAGELFFAGDDGTGGLELWRTNGTSAGTVPVTAAVYDSSFPSEPIAVGDKLFFEAEDTVVGRELWSTTGTAASTIPLDLRPGASTSSPQVGTAVGDRLVFTTGTNPSTLGVWSTDGTMAGTQHLLQANGLVTLHPESKVGGLAVFGASPAEDFSQQRNPWRSDGSPEGTSLIKNIGPYSNGLLFLATRGDALFFRASDPLCGGCPSLWRTDATEEGTVRIGSGQFGNAAISRATMHREILFFVNQDGVTGYELWVGDGTASGFRLVEDILPGMGSSWPGELTSAGNLVFFVTDWPPINLWRSDGTEAGTYPIKDFSPGPDTSYNVSGLTEMNGFVYFAADDGVHGQELWRSDGTAGGTQLVKDIWPGPGSALASNDVAALLAAGGKIFFAAYTPETGSEVWQSDGTEAGTVPLAEIAPGPRSSAPVPLGWAGTRAYFRAHDGVHGWEPWAVDLPVAVSIRDVTLQEGDSGAKDAVFEVGLSEASGQPVTVAYATADGSAVAAADYLPRAGTVTFAPGATGPVLVSVPIVGDLADEADESFVVDLTSPAGAVLADSQAVALVLDDDAPSVQVADLAVTEGNAGTVNADFLVTLTTPDGSATVAPKTFGFATEALTATAPADFLAGSGSMTFPAGTPSGSTAIARVVVNGDTAVEPDESLRVVLTSTSDVSPSDGVAIGTILDDDGGRSSSTRELVHGASLRTDLAAAPGADRDWYFLKQEPYASYEVVIDEVSGDVGPLRLRRWAGDGTTVLQSGTATGSGASVSLRWQNTTHLPVAGEHVSVESGGCGTDCGPDDTYRVRAYETTLSISRFNNTGGQVTFLILQNRSDRTISGRVLRWTPSGYAWAQSSFTLAPRAVQVTQVSSVSNSGSMTITHDGGYGDLVGKAVSLEPATGFSFDTPAEPRKR